MLPSPNGSTIASCLDGRAAAILGASLRNAAAVSRWISRHHDRRTVVAVVAAGERWPDGQLRPAVEDLWGAGAVIAGLRAAGWNAASPEAQLACAGYESIRGREHWALATSASGRELIAADHASDVEIAAEVNASAAVPLLVEGAFQHAVPPLGVTRSGANPFPVGGSGRGDS